MKKFIVGYSFVFDEGIPHMTPSDAALHNVVWTKTVPVTYTVLSMTEK